MSIERVDATRAKSAFAELHARAKEVDIAITKHGRVQSYMVSPARYKMLESVSQLGTDVLAELEAEFDARLASMQSSKQGAAVADIESLPLNEVLARGALASTHSPAAKSSRGRLKKRAG